MTSDILMVLAIFAGAFALGYIIGSRSAYRRGRDEQWVDDFLEAQERARIRRDNHGRFKSIK